MYEQGEETRIKNTTVFLLGHTCKLFHFHMGTAMEEIGLHRGQVRILSVLWEREGMTQRELAEELHRRPPTITHSLQRMERAGWIERRQDEEDQRVSRVYLTSAGRSIREEVEGKWQKLEKQALKGMSGDARTRLHAYLLKVLDNLVGEDSEVPLREKARRRPKARNQRRRHSHQEPQSEWERGSGTSSGSSRLPHRVRE